MATTLEEFKCTISHIVYQNPTNKYVIAKTKCENTITGYNNSQYQDLKGMDVALKGEWTEHKQYGKQFSFKELILDESPLFYFLSNVVKGIPKKELPKLMIKHSESELLDIIENNPKKLISLVKGIGDKRVEQIKTRWLKYKQVFKLSSFFLPYNISIVTIEKFYQHYCIDLSLKEEQFIEMVKENPYILTHIDGVGFKKADSIALKLGIGQLSFIRIKACVVYIIENLGENDGHTIVSKENILNNLDEYLYINIDENDPKKLSLNDKKDYLEKALDELVSEKTLIALDEYYAYNKYYQYEKLIFDKIQELRNTKKERMIDDIDGYILKKQIENKYEFSDEQKLAIQMVNSGLSIFSLCGYGGTGKTTIAKMILELFIDENNNNPIGREDIVCSALSGIATDRIRKKTGLHSMTLASMLMNKKTTVLPFKVYLIDESSMVNSMIFSQLLSKISPDSYVIFVGDPAQLPPIGTGDVFNDIIENGLTPLVTLKKIFRQSEKQVIKDFAKSIREGHVPKDYKNGVYEDFLFMPVEIENSYKLKADVKKGLISENVLTEKKQQNYLDIHRTVLEEYRKLSFEKNKGYLENKQYFEYLYDNQIIVPLKKGVIGVDNINESIQREQGFSDECVELYNKKFNMYDKVMHTMNMFMTIVDGKKYSLEDIKNSSYVTTQEKIFNGMVGVVLYLDKSEENIWVHFPIDNLYVCYSYEEAKELITLAYCTTIHKTQGSEYGNVVIPMSYSYFIMLNNKLLYTALTRARNYALFIGDSAAFNFTCMQFKDVKRKTVLQYLVRQDYPF